MTIDISKAGLETSDSPGMLDKAAPRTALATSGGAMACAACCVLPVAFPAIGLAGGGALLIWIDAATKVMFVAALLSVIGAWGWVIYRARSTGKRTAKATLLMMQIATAVLALGLAFPAYEPFLLQLIKG
ncbi:MAG: hypothetical protein KA085_02380 [Phenylobacterium sp.]|uniref:hypothetical protein n=1 Tax=Phenylobacterium sp. TaxID=1871053 RepID=UPI001B4F20D2|nr:hypothetical protein [Phenylobacterium sp.]MBP7814944.1 hypothetical protein [Phenylobacterium sp.]